MSQEKRTNILITLAGRAADPLWLHTCEEVVVVETPPEELDDADEKAFERAERKAAKRSF
jgi:hypothetical protein